MTDAWAVTNCTRGLISFLGQSYLVSPTIIFILATQLTIKADFQSMEFSELAEFLLFARENVALKLNR